MNHNLLPFVIFYSHPIFSLVGMDKKRKDNNILVQKLADCDPLSDDFAHKYTIR